MRERSRPRARFNGLVETPRLVPADWPIKTVVKQMRGTQGQAALVATRACPTHARQKQVVVNLVGYTEQGPRTFSARVWLIQVGTEEVTPSETLEELKIVKKAPTTMVTKASVWRDKAETAMVKELEEKKIRGLKECFQDLLADDKGEQIDIFKLQVEKDEIYGLMRIPVAELPGLLEHSGKAGIFLRTPFEKTDDYGILWMQGDASRSEDLAWQTAEKYQHAGLIRTRKGLGLECDDGLWLFRGDPQCWLLEVSDSV